MASEVRADGRVISLNITKPTPLIDLHGFQWRGAKGLAVEDVQPSPKVEAGRDVQQDEEHPRRRMRESGDQVPLQKQAAPAKDTVSPSFPLDVFEGAWAGNGFNLIFVPMSDKDLDKINKAASSGAPPGVGHSDNILILNLTTEQWTFGPNLGKIPNRGMEGQHTIELEGLSYLQTVQDVTNPLTGKPDRVETNKSGIHFEPGVWLRVPQSEFHKNTVNRDSIVRMASIPHGTTINAQGLVPGPEAKIKGRPDFKKADAANATPFRIGNPNGKIPFDSMNADQPNGFRVPKDLSRFNNKGTGRITSDIIQNPNLVLAKANEGLDIIETTTFQLSTGVGRDQGPTTAKLNGGGTTNISFLQGFQGAVAKKDPTKPTTTTTTTTLEAVTTPNDKAGAPNGNAESMTNTWWIEKVLYDVVVPPLEEGETATLWAKMPTVAGPSGKKDDLQPSTAPTPKFAVTAPRGGVAKETPIKVPGVQLQYSQTVHLNFGPKGGPMITWPHVSVATLVPVAPQPFQMVPAPVKV